MIKNEDIKGEKPSFSRGKSLTGRFLEKGNLANLLIESAKGEKGISFIKNNCEESFISYESIFRNSLSKLGELQERGVKPGQYVMLLFQENDDFIINFWACILGGIVPVPMAYPGSLSSKNAVLDKIREVWNILDRPAVLSDSRLASGYIEIEKNTDIRGMRILEGIKDNNSEGKIRLAETGSTAFIQFSSGSTSIPKGVILSHRNLLTNLESIASGIDLRSDDVGAYWMPLHHDLGLVGFHLGAVSMAIDQINIEPLQFIKKPSIWLDIISRRGATLTGSPNFGYKLLLKSLKEDSLKSWDLKSVRIIFNGAEPISIPVLNEFMDKLKVCGLAGSSMFPVYGMAEACLAVAFPPLGKDPLIHRLDRKILTENSMAQGIKETDGGEILFVDEGMPVAGMEVRISGSDGKVLPETHIGEIWIRGGNVTSGYINNPAATKSAFHGSWLRTGDLGYMTGGRLTVTGRVKDILFINGQKFYAHDIENKLEELEYVKTGKIALCGWHDQAEGKEKIGLFSALNFPKGEAGKYYREMWKFVNETGGVFLDYIVPVRSIPKTTSGKIRRFMLVRSFMNNEYGENIYRAEDFLAGEQSGRIPEKKGPYSELLTNIWAKVLERPAGLIPAGESFLSLGGNSIKAIQMLGYLEDELDIGLGHDLLINCRTINDINEYLVSKKYLETGGNNKNSPKNERSGKKKSFDIAVISLACRFPGADSPEKYWENIEKGRCNIGFLPADRWNMDDYYNADGEPGKTYCRKGAFLEDPYSFDAALFNISEEEAAVMDPQQRIILELVFELIERGGYSRKFLEGKNVGLFIGASSNSYYEYHLNSMNLNHVQNFKSFNTLSRDQKEALLCEWKNKFGFTGAHPNTLIDNILNMIAARASREFNLKGPSMVVDTACSSSLVTLHLACESILRGECEMALAGGINLLLTPTPFIYFSMAGVLSKSENSMVFDEKADGFVPGEGAGLVMLKALDRAVLDNDRILGVIKASSINNDGFSIGVMSPNPDSQRELIESAYRDFDIDPVSVQYIEAHGTGTKIGDPSEVRALDNALKGWNPPGNSIALGSVKSNIGHLLSAAGIAGFIKVILAMNNKRLPPNVNLIKRNPLIKFERTPFYLSDKAAEWIKNPGHPRRAAINSFGFGGTNCHMVVEEAPEIEPVNEGKIQENIPRILCISAHTESALSKKAGEIGAFIKSRGEYSLADICSGLNRRDPAFKHRYFAVADSAEKMAGKLEKHLFKSPSSLLSPKYALMFTGAGPQYSGMGLKLYRDLPVFRKYILKAEKAFSPYMEKSLTETIYGDKAGNDALSSPDTSSAAVFAIDYAMGMLLLEAGIKPAFLMGHGCGELAALCVSSALGLEDAAKLINIAGRITGADHSPYKKASLLMPDKDLEILLKPFSGRIWITEYNIRSQVVLGKPEAIDELLEVIRQKDIAFGEPAASDAMHTPLIKPALELFMKELDEIKFNPPEIPVLSSAASELMQSEADSLYLVKLFASPVHFDKCAEHILNFRINLMIEAGPGETLACMVKGLTLNAGQSVLPSMKSANSDWEDLLELTGRLYYSGAKINWNVLETGISVNNILFPPYPFERKIFRPDFGTSGVKSAKECSDSWFYEWKWENEQDCETSGIEPGSVIIFNDDENLGKALEEKFDAVRNPVFHVRTGGQFDYNDLNLFTVRAGNENDYHALIGKIPGRVSCIIHLHNYNQGKVPVENLISEKDIVGKSAYSLFYAVKALVEKKSGKVRLMIVTGNANYISGDYPVENPHQSLAVIFGQVMDQENADIASNIVDLDKYSNLSPGDLADILYGELNKRSNMESMVSVRKDSRLVRKLSKPVSPDKEKAVRIAEGDTYLITGGAGLVGFDIAGELARQAGINLVLTGRQVLPPRPDWGNKDLDPRIKEKIKAIIELEEIGAKVLYYPVDVSDHEEMKKMIGNIHSELGPLHGVVHAAGLWDFSSFKLLKKQIGAVEKILSPKVEGTVITDMVTRNEPLKFFVMLSSVAATRKAWSESLGDYAAGNYFLDYYSYFRSGEKASGRTLAINYSLWSNKGEGTAFGEITRYAARAQGLKPLSPALASKAFIDALFYNRQNVLHVIDYLEAPKIPENAVLRDEAKNREPFGRSGIKNKVFQLISRQLNIPPDNLDTGMDFLSLGLDSTNAARYVHDLGLELNMELYPTLIFEFQTPDALADYIEKTLNSDAKEPQDRDNNGRAGSDIAIIGMSLRIPGAGKLDEYWDILRDGICVIRDVPEDRWLPDENYDADVNSLHTSYVMKGGFIDKPYDFDPLFFGMSPVEAEACDPQQRIFLEVAWEALQMSGYGGKYRTDKIGVFVGSEQNTYMEHFLGYRTFALLKNRLLKNDGFNNLGQEHRKDIISDMIDILKPGKLIPDAIAGNGLNEIAGRVSHCFNLKGPSLTVNTACSSSLTALHLACDSIRLNQAEMAIVGGVHLNLSPSPFVSLSRVTALSPTGNCYPFDKRADGMVLSEGASAILIKPLEKAQEDGDSIYAVIKGSAINNDGHSQGLTAPLPQGQAEAIIKAYQNASINPETVSYVETHGTGTPLGDPIEFQGMNLAFKHFTDKRHFCGMGSVKSSIGHMLSASGLVSLIKVSLSLKNKTIPPTVNYEQANPYISFSDSPFYMVGKTAKEWKSEGENPLRAGINAFGFGGSNAHIILEAPPENGGHGVTKPPYPVFLTGRNENVVKIISKELREYIMKNPGISLSSVCRTLDLAQKEMPFKAAAVVRSADQLTGVLLSLENGISGKDVYKGRSNPNRETKVHLYLGKSFLPDENRIEDFCARFSAFGEAYRLCREKLGALSAEVQSFGRFAFQYSLGMLLVKCGISPLSIISENTGWISGAVLTNLISLEQAIRIIADKTCVNHAPGPEIKTGWTCPIVTPAGVFSRKNPDIAKLLDNDLKKILTPEDYAGIPGKNDAIIYLEDDAPVKGLSPASPGLRIGPDEALDNPGSFLALLAKSYTLGVRFNPGELFEKGERRIPLPTYPFENATYRIFQNKEQMLGEEISKLPYKRGLKKIEKVNTLTENEKSAAYEMLKRDLNINSRQ